MKIHNIFKKSIKKDLVGGSLSQVIKNGDCVIKYYDGKDQRGYEKLRKEIKYLQDVPKEKKRFFPKVLNIQNKERLVSYSMPFYYKLRTISDLAFGRKHIENVWESLRKSLDLADKIFYSTSGIKTPRRYGKKVHLDRAKQALNFFRNSQDYKELVNKKELVLNGEKLKNISVLINKLKEDKKSLRLLSPKKLTFFHGNFHTDNILINEKKIIFSDPRGEKIGSENYDKAKMFAHFFIEYDAIHIGKFRFEKSANSFNIWIRGRRVSGRYLYLQKKFLEYEFKRHVNNQEYFRKMLLIGAIHALSFSTYHARKNNPNKKRVIIYYLGAVKMLNDFYNNRNIAPIYRAFKN